MAYIDEDNPKAHAIEEAVRYRTVGIVYGSGKSKWREIGTGNLVLWRGRALVLTAEHIVHQTDPADLRFFPPFASPPVKVERPVLAGLKGAPNSALQSFIELQLLRIHREAVLDLAAIELDPSVAVPKPAEFFELLSGGVSPKTGETVTLTGYPVDLTRQLNSGDHAGFLQADWGEVAPPDVQFAGFDPATHFTFPYGQREQFPDARPHGFSGAAVWFRKSPTPGFWHANIDIGGVVVTWHATHNRFKAVRREFVERFLTESIGS